MWLAETVFLFSSNLRNRGICGFKFGISGAQEPLSAAKCHAR